MYRSKSLLAEASPAVEILLQQTFTAAAQTRGQALTVRDLVPLPPSDPKGTTAFNILLGLILAGTLGSTIIFQAGQFLSPRRRLRATVALGLGAGLMAALVTKVVVRAFPGPFFAVWGVAALFALAIGVPIAAFQALFGLGGTAIGAFMFLVIGNPASGGSSTFSNAVSLSFSPSTHASGFLWRAMRLATRCVWRCKCSR